MSASEPVTPDDSPAPSAPDPSAGDVAAAKPPSAPDPSAGDVAAAKPPSAPDPSAGDVSAAKREARRTDARSRVTGVIVVGMSVAVWWPAFTLGAWGDFFFDQMLTIWAAASGAFLVVLIQPRGKPRVGRALALLIPSLWLFLSFLTADFDPDNWVAQVVTVLGVLVGILAIPATIWVLARMIWPEFAEDITWPRRFVIIGAVLLIAVASFLLGVNQSKFLTCDDFSVSGNSNPPGCSPPPVDSP
ncbi:hypothetical protein ACEXQE_14585 [Herbiconiux sp. P17]|uniref:hypothetical protein n=1 Tax=Herbiconiux wuyangfengii TaxID=3342794 RepID=UPI0035B725AB